MCAPGATAASLHQDVLLPLPGSAHWLAPVLSQRSGALETASFCPPPAPFPSPPFWLYLICCHLRTREQARAPAASIMHGRLGHRALSGLPAPAPHRCPTQSRRGWRGVRQGGKRKWPFLPKSWAPTEANSSPPPEVPLLQEGTQIRHLQPAVRGKWGGGAPPFPAAYVHLYCSPSL